ncbi:hypothetical protein KY289_030669 [Solanum tuberosum]|nr:hypothetical protein KY289_030669 [Solanum tuberosum]
MTNGSIFNPFYNHIQQHSSGKPSKSHLGETNFKQRFECDIGIVLVLRCDVDLEIGRVTEFFKELSAVAIGGDGDIECNEEGAAVEVASWKAEFQVVWTI